MPRRAVGTRRGSYAEIVEGSGAARPATPVGVVPDHRVMKTGPLVQSHPDRETEGVADDEDPARARRPAAGECERVPVVGGEGVNLDVEVLELEPRALVRARGPFDSPR